MTPEITNWRKSTRSGNTANCVEVGSAITNWRKSTRSGAQSNCVEVGSAGVVGVRDSKDRNGPALLVHPAAWEAFTDTLKADQLS